jgi:hypothetical protein
VNRPLDRDTALALYAELGFATTPLAARGKRPLRKGWQTPSSDAWLDALADANVGVLCGAPSGNLVVLDFDTQDGLFEVLGFRPPALAALTIVVQTARGWHVYAHATGVRTSSPRPGLDIRSDGALVVAPPSVHPSGHEYAFVAVPRRVADLSEFAGPEILAKSSEESVVVPSSAETLVLPVVDLVHAASWISAQAPRLREAWALLNGDSAVEFDRSRADFAVARCLWEGGYSPEEVAAVLLGLPSSKARERGESYALRTALRARQASSTGQPSSSQRAR